MNTNYSGLFSKSLNALDATVTSTLHGNSQVSNPLDKFPTKGDVIRGTFMAKKLKPIAKSQLDSNNSSSEHEQWLYPDKIPDTSVSQFSMICLIAKTTGLIIILPLLLVWCTYK